MLVPNITRCLCCSIVSNTSVGIQSGLGLKIELEGKEEKNINYHCLTLGLVFNNSRTFDLEYMRKKWRIYEEEKKGKNECGGD